MFSQAVCTKRRTRDADTVSDNVHALAGGDGRACGLKIFSGEGTWPSAETSLGTSRDEPGQGALANEITLKLCEGSHHVKKHSATCGCGVDVVGERTKADAMTFEFRHEFDEMCKRAAEPIELSDDQHIALAQGVDQAGKHRPIGLGTRGFLAEDAVATCALERIGLWLSCSSVDTRV